MEERQKDERRPSDAKRRAHRGRRVPRLIRRGEPGTSPGTLIADPNAASPVTRLLSYDAARIEEKADLEFDQLPMRLAEDQVVWIDVVGLGDVRLIERIGEQYGFHPLTLEDVVNQHQRPKFEDYDDHAYLVLQMVVPGLGAETEQLSVFLCRGLVLSFQQRPGDCFDPVRQRIRRGKGRIRNMPADYLFYSLIDAVIDGYYPLLETFGEALEDLESAVLAAPKPAHIEQLHTLKRDLLTVRRAVWPTRDLLSSLLRDETPLISAETRVFLRDAYDHTVQLIDIVETYREISSGLIDAYLSSLSTKLNEVMKVLTILATVFLPLTVITGLYGMNFDRSSPWNMPELGWRFGYLFSLGAMALSSAVLVYFFWRKGWLRRPRRLARDDRR